MSLGTSTTACQSWSIPRVLFFGEALCHPTRSLSQIWEPSSLLFSSFSYSWPSAWCLNLVPLSHHRFLCHFSSFLAESCASSLAAQSGLHPAPLVWLSGQIPDTLMWLWNLACRSPRSKPTAHIFNTLCSFLPFLPWSAMSLFYLTSAHPSSHSLSLTSAPLAWSALAPHTPPVARCSSWGPKEPVLFPSRHCLVKNCFFSLVSSTSLKFQMEFTPSWSSRDPSHSLGVG